MPVGSYTALVETASDRRIVATGRGEVLPHAAHTMELQALQTEVEGTLTINGSLPPHGVRLIFRNSREPYHEWDASIDGRGSFRVAIDTSLSGESTCPILTRDPSLNEVKFGCHQFFAGLQRFDIDVPMPPGVLRIDVPPAAHVSPMAFGRITISESDDPLRGFATTFKLIRGLRGDFIAKLDRDYRIILSDDDSRTVLASARVPLSTDRADVQVRLLIPPR